MDIKCPHCGTEYDAEENECGRVVKCEICGKEFVAGESFAKKLGEATAAMKDAARIAAHSVCEKARDIDWKEQGKRAKAIAGSVRDKSREWYRSVRGKCEELGLPQKISQWRQSVKSAVKPHDEVAMADEGVVIDENVAGGNMNLMAGGVVAGGVNFSAIANEQRWQHVQQERSQTMDIKCPFCGKIVPGNAKRCPFCGGGSEKLGCGCLSVVGIIFAVFFIVLLMYLFSDIDELGRRNPHQNAIDEYLRTGEKCKENTFDKYWRCPD